MRWRAYVPAGIMLVGAIVGWVVGTPQPTPLRKPLAAAAPDSFLGAAGRPMPLDSDETRLSGVTAYLNQTYAAGSVRPVQLYIGYHATQHGDKRMHSPSLCLPGAGWTAIAARIVPLSLGDSTVSVNRYILQNGRYRMLVYYWFQGRGRITAGETGLKVRSIWDALVSRRDDEALVRIIVPVDNYGDRWPMGAARLLADTIATRLAVQVAPRLDGVLTPAP